MPTPPSLSGTFFSPASERLSPSTTGSDTEISGVGVSSSRIVWVTTEVPRVTPGFEPRKDSVAITVSSDSASVSPFTRMPSEPVPAVWPVRQLLPAGKPVPLTMVKGW